MKNFIYHKDGFTLIEVVISILILMMAALMLSLYFSEISKTSSTLDNLANEDLLIQSIHNEYQFDPANIENYLSNEGYKTTIYKEEIKKNISQYLFDEYPNLKVNYFVIGQRIFLEIVKNNEVNETWIRLKV